METGLVIGKGVAVGGLRGEDRFGDRKRFGGAHQPLAVAREIQSR